MKASIRAKVEHPFHVVKNLFRHRKARYKGMAKNTAQRFSLFGLACWRRPKIDPPMGMRLKTWTVYAVRPKLLR
jgi:hypothetical protein